MLYFESAEDFPLASPYASRSCFISTGAFVLAKVVGRFEGSGSVLAFFLEGESLKTVRSKRC